MLAPFISPTVSTSCFVPFGNLNARFHYRTFLGVNLTPRKPITLAAGTQRTIRSPGPMSQTSAFPGLCSLSITYSTGAPVEHLSLLACANQKATLQGGRSVESEQLPQLPKDGGSETRAGGGGCGCTLSVVNASLLNDCGKGCHPW